MTDGDFYEDDEPVEKITAAFERDRKFVTGPPLGRTVILGPDLRPIRPTRVAGPGLTMHAR